MKTKSWIDKERDSEKKDIENRALEFANKIRIFVKKLNETTANKEDVKKIINSSGSIGANYIKAHNSSNKKDFLQQIKICQEKAEESRFWLSLLDTDWNPEQELERKKLIHETTGLINTFNLILHSEK